MIAPEKSRCLSSYGEFGIHRRAVKADGIRAHRAEDFRRQRGDCRTIDASRQKKCHRHIRREVIMDGLAECGREGFGRFIGGTMRDGGRKAPIATPVSLADTAVWAHRDPLAGAARETADVAVHGQRILWRSVG